MLMNSYVMLRLWRYLVLDYFHVYIIINITTDE